MYYADLSEYQYTPALADRRLLNFGWLAAGQAFECCAPDGSWLSNLALAAANFVNAYRGTHACDFCGASDVSIQLGERQVLLGHAELWIPAPDGRIFIGPTLVYHYVTAHSYRPPDAVIEALTKLPGDFALWDTPDGHYRRLLRTV